MIDPILLALTLHGICFFALSPSDARALAQRTMELSSEGDNEADVATLYALVWRANRDERRIRDGAHNLPVHYLLDAPLPASFLIDEVSQATAHDHLFRSQSYDELERYEVQLPQWRRDELDAAIAPNAEHHHEHEHPSPVQGRAVHVHPDDPNSHLEP